MTQKITNIISHKMKKKKIKKKLHVVGTFLKSNRKIIKRGKIDTQDRTPHFPNKSGGIKLVRRS